MVSSIHKSYISLIGRDDLFSAFLSYVHVHVDDILEANEIPVIETLKNVYLTGPRSSAFNRQALCG